MKASAKIIETLNEVLLGELTAINQYFLHAKMCKNWGYGKLADKVYKESIDEMKHASNLTDRILFLDGIPNLQKLGKLNIGTTVEEQLASDLEMEKNAIALLIKSIELCYTEHDHVTRELLENILKEEESHIDWLETQIQVIGTLGLKHYLAQQI